MGSRKEIFLPEDLTRLDCTLAGALAKISDLGGSPEAAKPTLMRRLFDAASTGITDLEVLQSEALKSMNESLQKI